MPFADVNDIAGFQDDFNISGGLPEEDAREINEQILSVPSKITQPHALSSMDEQARTGIPLETVSRNLAEVTDRRKSDETREINLVDTAPSTAKYAGESEVHRAALGDNIKEIGYVEKVLRSIKGGWQRGWLLKDLEKYGTKMLLGKELTERERMTLEFKQEDMASIPDPKLDYFSEMPGAVAEQIPVMAGILKGGGIGAGGGAAVGTFIGGVAGIPAGPGGVRFGAWLGAKFGAAFGFKFGGGIAGGLMEASHAMIEYESIKDENGVPINRNTAKGAAAVVGVVNGALEFVGFNMISQAVPGLRGLTRTGVKRVLKNLASNQVFAKTFKSIGVAMAGEAATEFLQELSTITGKELLQLNADGELEDASTADILGKIFSEENLASALHAAKKGSQAGGGFAIGGRALGHVTEGIKVKEAKLIKAAMSDVMNTVNNSKLMAKLPRQTRKIIQDMADEGDKDTVYIDPGEWETYFQSKGVDPDEVITELLGEDGAAELAKAKEEGRDVQMPLADFVTKAAGSAHSEFFQNNMKFDPDDFSAKQADDYVMHAEQEAAESQKEAKKKTKDIGKVQKSLEEKFAGTDLDADTSASYIQLLVEGFATISERVGVSANELYSQYGLGIAQVENQIPEEEKTDEQAVGETLDASKEKTEDKVDENIKDEQIHKQDERGQIKVDRKGRRFRIELLKTADKTTFLHESGHLFFEILADQSENQGKGQVHDDFQSILKWLGAKDLSSVTREQYEKWAVGFEKYLGTGEAPSIELRQAFEKFSAWIKGIYLHLRGLDVELSDEIIGVMDRMLAVDADIELARKDFGHTPMIKDIAQNMSEKQAIIFLEAIEKSQLSAKKEIEGNHERRLRIEQTRFWREKRSEIKEIVENAVHADKRYIALSALTRGKMPDGTPLSAPIKISKESLIEVVGKEGLKSLPRIYSAKGGADVGLVAEALGFNKGGKHFVEMLKALKPMNNEISDTSDRITNEQYGPKVDESLLRLEAAEAVHNEDTAKVMRLELQYLISNEFAKFKGLAKKFSMKVPTLKVVRAQARRIIAVMEIRDVRPSIYRNAERKAGNMAQDAFLKGNFKAAFQHKQRQLLNHELYRESRIAIEQIDKNIKFLSRFKKKRVIIALGKAGGQYLEQVQALLERYSLQKISGKALSRREGLRSWVDSQRKAGNEILVPDSILDEIGKKHYREMSTAEFADLRYTIESIEHTSKIKNNLLSLKEKRKVATAVEEITASVALNFDITPERISHVENKMKERKGFVRSLVSGLTKMEFLFNSLDGNKSNGVVWNYFFKPLVDAENHSVDLKERIKVGMEHVYRRYSKKEMKAFYKEIIYIPEMPGDHKMTKDKILGVALNVGNPYNRQALLEGFGWDETVLEAILAHMTKKDWDTVQDNWNLVNSFWPEIVEHERAITGMVPKKVDAVAFNTEFGQYEGGYFPVTFDSKLSIKDAKIEAQEAVQGILGGDYVRSMTAHGFTKERNNSGGKPINISLSITQRHLLKVAHDLSHRKAVLDIQKLLDQKEIQDVFIAAVGRENFMQILPWLNDIAADMVVGQNAKSIHRFLKALRVGNTYISMAWKTSTALVQPFGYSLTVKELGAKWTLNGVSEMVGSGMDIKEKYEEILAKSAFLRGRMKNHDRDIHNAGQLLGDEHFIHKYAFFFVGAMDMVVSMPTWLGAYNQALTGEVENIEIGDEQAAIDHGDHMVRMTQGSGGLRDLAAVQRGDNLSRLLTMFYSFFNTLFNQNVKIIRQVGFDGPSGYAELFRAYVLMNVIPALFEDLVLGRMDDDDWENLPSWAAKKILAYPFYSIVAVRELVNAASSDFGYTASPVIGTAKDLLKLWDFSTEVAFGDKTTDDVSKVEVKAAANLLGVILKLPSRQAMLTMGYLYDINEGNEDPEGLGEFTSKLLLKGSDRKK